MQAFEFFVRFTVDPKDLEKAVNDVLSDHDKTTRAQHSYTSLSIANAPPSPDEPFLLPMPWWNPRSITNGYYCGSTKLPKNGSPFDVWVDTDRHTIYLCETD
jgi:hypothetical protein